MSKLSIGNTLAMPTIAVAAITVAPEYTRLPRRGDHDSLFGLTRSYLNLLILPSKENGFRPAVRSSVLRKGNAKTGVRLVNVASLRAYLKNQTKTEAEQTPVPTDREGLWDSPSTISNVEFMRLPKAKERDPLFGLSRSFLNQLILPCSDNGYRPLVRSHVLRRRGYRNGIRLIDVESLRDYIKAHEEPGASAQPSATHEPRAEQGEI